MRCAANMRRLTRAIAFETEKRDDTDNERRTLAPRRGTNIGLHDDSGRAASHPMAGCDGRGSHQSGNASARGIAPGVGDRKDAAPHGAERKRFVRDPQLQQEEHHAQHEASGRARVRQAIGAGERCRCGEFCGRHDAEVGARIGRDAGVEAGSDRLCRLRLRSLWAACISAALRAGCGRAERPGRAQRLSRRRAVHVGKLRLD